MNGKKLSIVEQSFIDLYRIYKPKDLDSFVKKFVEKYKQKGYEERLKKLVVDNE